MLLLYHKHKKESSPTFASSRKEFNIDGTLRAYSVTILKPAKEQAIQMKDFLDQRSSKTGILFFSMGKLGQREIEKFDNVFSRVGLNCF